MSEEKVAGLSGDSLAGLNANLSEIEVRIFSENEVARQNNSNGEVAAGEMSKDTRAWLDNSHARLKDGSTRADWDEGTGEKCCSNCEELMRD